MGMGCLLGSMAQAETRTWTSKGQAIVAEYTNSSADTVTVRQPGTGQAFRLLLADCSAEDREYVQKKQAEAKEADMVTAIVRGRITWRLPSFWNSMSWSNNQPADLWIWDEAAQKPLQKIATVMVKYDGNFNRNEMVGTFASESPLRLPKSARYVLKQKFQGTVNGGAKDIEQMSASFSLPALSKDGIDLHTVHFIISR